MSKALELLPTLIFLLNLGFSENFSIRGYIKNKMTNKPIKNVSVYLKDLRLGTTTDENGIIVSRLFKKGAHHGEPERFISEVIKLKDVSLCSIFGC